MRMDLIDVLVEDHRALNRALSRYEDLPADARVERHEAAQEIKRRWRLHSITEQQFLHPMIAVALPSGPDIVSGELHDHHELARLLRKLDDAGSEEVAHRLIDFARAHMEAEERTLFPLLRRVVEPTDLDAVGEEIRMNREADRAGTP